MPRSGSGSASARSSSAATIASIGAARGGRCRRRAAGVRGRSSRRRRRSRRGSRAASRWQTIARSASSWSGVGSIRPARRSWPSPRLLRGRLGLALARSWRALAVLGGGVAQVVVVEARAGEVGRSSRAGSSPSSARARWRTTSSMNTRVDDPDAGGEVGAAVEHVGVAAVGGAVAQRGVDAQLERARAGLRRRARRARVELVGRAAEHAGGLRAARGGEVRAGARRAASAASSRAPSSIRTAYTRLVLDDGAVHEGAEVAQRRVVQLAGGDPRRRRPR